MIPIRDSIPSRKKPVVNYLIISVNCVVFLWELSLNDWEMQMTALSYGLVPARLFKPDALPPTDFPFFLSFFTAMFLHGGWGHILGNMWFLYVFGDNVEDAMGSIPYLLFYLLSGLAAALLQILVHPLSMVPMIGASGAISGVLGAYWKLFPRSRILTLVPVFSLLQFMEIPAVIFIGFWFVMQMFSGVASLAMPGGVAWWAHIGGFLAGMWLLKYFAADRQSYGYWR